MPESLVFHPGDAVWTSFGAGVVVGESKNTDHDGLAFFYQVRLWRVPGKSIASSSLAYLTPSSILERLPAAPGMTTRLRIPLLENSKDDNENDEVLVHSYYPMKRIFLVSPRSTEKKEEKGHLLLSKQESSSLLQQEQLQYVTADDLITAAPTAKVYPILEVLMHRAEQTAEATRHLLQSEQTQHWVDQTGRVVGETAGRLLEQTQKQQANGGAVVDQLKTAAREAAPQVDESFHQVLAIMKDEQLTDLLMTCRERLQELVQTTNVSHATQQVLQKTGIRIVPGSSTEHNALPQSVEESRKAALSAIDNLLKQANIDSLENVKKELATNFTTAFDSLSTAAKSDRGLSELFQTISEKTTAWQQVTGRLLQTRSASLFLEGASRLQARAASILRKQGHLDWAGEIGSKLTKSFTEGDVAVARIKSIELGEAVKTKLIEAIEVRSESLGGLDGIIAGALATVETKQKNHSGGGNPIQTLLTALQANATSVTADARETLISMLSSQSKYRDLVLLRLEHVMCHLGNHLGDNMTPEDIAAIARGEGGTKRIFEPIAKRAMQQIDKQLNTAESQVKDGSVQEVLKRVRKIMSGEMSPAAVMDEIVAILNDDKVVAAGETLVQHSEHVLDVLEGVSGNKAVADALQIAEKAGITKDSVMREIEKLDVDVLIGTAGSAVTDERARRKLISSAIDTALDFALRVLPSMPVPPFEGVKDGLVYQISNLSMEGFRVSKEDIQIELAGMRASRKSQSSIKASGTGDSESSGMDSLGSSDSSDSSDTIEVEESHAEVKATELLIIDISNISAVLENAIWSFEQTYMPYLKGDGKANVKMTGGAIRLQFELRRRRSPNNDKWEPVLCLHDRSCSIAEVELNLKGEGRLTWILNKLAGIFKGPLRDYVVRTIVRVLTNRSGWILRRLNDILSPYWDLILRTAKLNMDDLMVADDRVVIEETKSVHDSLIELVWRESLPLGMNLLTNDRSGLLKVVDFPRGSQARVVCERRNLNPDIFEGATIVAVNGAQFDDSEELFDALKEPGRPKTVRFKLAESEELEKLRAFVDGGKPDKSEDGEQSHQVLSRDYTLREVKITSTGEIGIEFGTSIDNRALVVESFLQHPDGIVFEAEKSGMIQFGDVLTHINNESVVGKSGPAHAIQLLQDVAAIRPLSLKFSDPYIHYVKISRMADVPGLDNSGGVEELVLKEVQTKGSSKRVAIAGFKGASGMAESSGILIGDHLVFVNGAPVGAGCYWVDGGPSPSLDEIHQMLEDDASYPIGLTFARPKLNDRGWNPDSQRGQPLRDDQAETICVTAENKERIGCVFVQGEYGNVTVCDFNGVPGVFQRSFVSPNGSKLPLPQCVELLNGQFVPSYASVEMVRNAMKRAWRSDGGIEMTLCDDGLKAWIEQVTQDES